MLLMPHDQVAAGTPEQLRTFYLQHSVDLSDMAARYRCLRESMAWPGDREPTLSQLEERFLSEHLTVGGRFR